MLELLKEQVFQANIKLWKNGLVALTWGNVSGIDREHGLVVIKPSGAPYECMRASDMVVVQLSDGEVVEGAFRPSSDTPAHLVLYRNFLDIGGITHTHSRFATVFAQANEHIQPLGTTHADYFHGAIPCTRRMTPREIHGDYERETGRVIVETFREKKPMETPAVLVANHGPFTWGKNPIEAVNNAITLEEVAHIAWHTLVHNPHVQGMQKDLMDKHYQRKHGSDAYYGQKGF